MAFAVEDAFEIPDPRKPLYLTHVDVGFQVHFAALVLPGGDVASVEQVLARDGQRVGVVAVAVGGGPVEVVGREQHFDQRRIHFRLRVDRRLGDVVFDAVGLPVRDVAVEVRHERHEYRLQGHGDGLCVGVVVVPAQRDHVVGVGGVALETVPGRAEIRSLEDVELVASAGAAIDGVLHQLVVDPPRTLVDVVGARRDQLFEQRARIDVAVFGTLAVGVVLLEVPGARTEARAGGEEEGCGV